MHTDTWRVQKQGQYSSAVVLRGDEAAGDLEIVAKAYGIEGHSDEAVAHLIAAAPELLAALKALTLLVEVDYGGVDCLAQWRQAVAAIAKAEGRTE